jgi:hypothetical protein
MDFEVIAATPFSSTYTVKFLTGEFAGLTLSWFGVNNPFSDEIAPSGKLRDYWYSFYPSIDRTIARGWIIPRTTVISPPAPVVFKGHFNAKKIVRDFISFI